MANLQFTDEEVKKISLQTETNKCASCGARMVFSPIAGKLICEHCGATKDIESKQAKEVQYRDVFADNVFTDDEEWTNELVSYRCSSCGAVSLMEKYEVATVCPFCHTPNIAIIKDVNTLKPNAIVPFKVSKDASKLYATKWLKKKFFAPSKLKKQIKLESPSGIYFPCWTFDFITLANYKGVLGRTVTRTVGSGKNRRTVTRTEYFKVSGSMAYNYDDIIVEASNKITQNEVNKLGNFNTRTAFEYNKDFIAGYTAQRYDKELDIGMSEAKSQVYKDYERKIMSRHNATSIRTLNIDIDYKSSTFKYCLLPLYISNYAYKYKEYSLMINGTTGKTYGKIPLSPIKVGLTSLFAAALIVLLAYFWFF